MMNVITARSAEDAMRWFRTMEAVSMNWVVADTRGDIGYVVMDIETTDPLSLFSELREIPATIRARILH